MEELEVGAFTDILSLEPITNVEEQELLKFGATFADIGQREKCQRGWLNF